MFFLIIAKDREDCERIRDELRPRRLHWLEDNKSRIVAAGGMTDDYNRHVNGGLMIVEFNDRAEAESFANEDPFTSAGLYKTLKVVRWRRVYFNHERITSPDPFLAD